jgi:hypothetical protein
MRGHISRCSKRPAIMPNIEQKVMPNNSQSDTSTNLGYPNFSPS